MPSPPSTFRYRCLHESLVLCTRVLGSRYCYLLERRRWAEWSCYLICKEKSCVRRTENLAMNALLADSI